MHITATAADCGRFSICYSDSGTLLNKSRFLLRIAAASRFATVDPWTAFACIMVGLRIAAASRFATVLTS